MADLTLSVAHRAARNAASIALADTGAGSGAIRIYTAAPASGGTLLVTIALQKPCGAIVPETGQARLLTDASAPPLCVASGIATWGEWVSGAGDVIGAGPAAAEGAPDAADACFIITDTESGTAQLYAGGTLALDEMVLG